MCNEIFVLTVLTPEGFLRGKAKETMAINMSICGQVSVFFAGTVFCWRTKRWKRPEWLLLVLS